MLPVWSKLLLCSFSVLHLYTSRPLLHIRNVPFDWLYFPIKARCVQWNQNYKVINCSVLSSTVMPQILQILQGSYRSGFAQVIFGNWMCFCIEGEITIQIRCTVLADSYWMFYSFSLSNSLFAGNYFSRQNFKILHALCFAYCDIWCVELFIHCRSEWTNIQILGQMRCYVFVWTLSCEMLCSAQKQRLTQN